MATLLYLNNTRVYPDSNQQIKLVRENPYFTQSESYTLDVTLPMDILENRDFFQNIQRFEHSKRASAMSCRLVVNNKPLLQGSAKVTQVTEKEVKVQLIGGLSEINFLSNENKTYIDEMNMGGATHTYIPSGSGRGGTWETNEMPVRYVCPVVYNETGGYMRNDAPCPHLNDVLEEVLKESGYALVSNDRDIVPWNNIYIASAKRTLYLSHALPHWTVKEFVDEYCRFFNCTLVVDMMLKTVKVVSNNTFFSSIRHAEITPMDEYSVELSDDSEGSSLATANICYDLSDSAEHDYDIIPDNIRDSAPTLEYSSRSEAWEAYNHEMSEEERLKYIYKTPVGRWVGWKHDYSDVGGGERTLFTQIDVFGPLVRVVGNESEISLKICPVAISEDHTYAFSGRGSSWTCRIPSIEGPTGDESGTRGRSSDEETNTIQEYIEGEADIEKSEKEDRMQVFFMDDILQDSICLETSPRSSYSVGDIVPRLMPFTDSSYKKNHGGNAHRLWSLSLNPTGDEHYLGELHQNNYTFDMKAKYCVKFLADEIPDPTQVFIIRNKRFACEKVEAQIDNQGLQQLMTGYFYEML